MNKKLFGLAVFGMFALLLFSALGSAYSYYGGVYGSYGPYHNDDYDRTTYHVTRTSGNGPWVTTKDTFYDRTSEEYYDHGTGEWVDRTTYIRETREDPGYYRDYGRGYHSGGYGNTIYRPWYRSYWDDDCRAGCGYYVNNRYDPYRYRYY
jgi:hypothetical protein